MEEDEYIQLQTLLIKLRVASLKMLGNENLIPKIRDNEMKIIRYVDWLRNHITFKEREDKHEE